MSFVDGFIYYFRQMEDIIKEKAEGGDIGDESIFFDRSDDVEEPFDWDTPEEEEQELVVSSIGAASGEMPVQSAFSTDGAATAAMESRSGPSTPFQHLRPHSTLSSGHHYSSSAMGDIHFLIQTVPVDAMQHVTKVGLYVMEW